MHPTLVPRLFLTLLLISTTSCIFYPKHVSTRVEKVTQNLQCGLSLDQIHELTKLTSKKDNPPLLGEYGLYLGRHHEAIWISFEDDKLTTFTTTRAVPVTTVLISPHEDLCNNKHLLRVRLNFPGPDNEFKVELDGEPVLLEDYNVVRVPTGTHTLTVKRDGFRTVDRVLEVELGRLYRSIMVIQYDEMIPVGQPDPGS